MVKQNIIRNTKIKYRGLLSILIFVFSFILTNISTAFSPTKLNNYQILIHDIFHGGLFHYKFYSLFELLFILILVLLAIKFKPKFTSGKKLSKILLSFAIICYIFRMINPNSDTETPILGMPLFSNVNEYTFILFVFVILFTNKYAIAYFYKTLFKYVFIFSNIKAILVLIPWGLFNTGIVRFANLNVTLWQTDLLYIFSLMQAISLWLYLRSKRKIYLLSSLLFLIVGFFSQQRGTFFPGIFTSVFIIIFYYVITKKKLKAIFTILFLVFIIPILISILTQNEQIKLTMERYLAVNPNYQSNYDIPELSDSGHWKQTIYTSLDVINKFPIWGIGYGNTESAYLYGESIHGWIHNAYASIWYKYGLLSLLFYLYIFYIIINYYIKNLKLMLKYKHPLYYLKISILFYLIIYFLGSAFTVEGNLTRNIGQIIWLLPLAFVLRIDRETYNLFFGENDKS